MKTKNCDVKCFKSNNLFMKCWMDECYHFQWFIFHSWMISMIITVFVWTFVIWGSLSLKKGSYLGCQILTLALQHHLLTFLHFGSLPTVLSLLLLKLIINWILDFLPWSSMIKLLNCKSPSWLYHNLPGDSTASGPSPDSTIMNENRINTCLK